MLRCQEQDRWAHGESGAGVLEKALQGSQKQCWGDSTSARPGLPPLSSLACWPGGLNALYGLQREMGSSQHG